MASLRSRGDLDDLMFQVRPWKIVGGPVDVSDDESVQFTAAPVPANVAVAHLDLNRVALWLMGEAIHDGEAEEDIINDNGETEFEFPEEFEKELKVMVLLRV